MGSPQGILNFLFLELIRIKQKKGGEDKCPDGINVLSVTIQTLLDFKFRPGCICKCYSLGLSYSSLKFRRTLSYHKCLLALRRDQEVLGCSQEERRISISCLFIIGNISPSFFLWAKTASSNVPYSFNPSKFVATAAMQEGAVETICSKRAGKTLIKMPPNLRSPRI